MKASEASVRIALASQSEPITRISGKMFGRTWPARMRVSEKPSERQASTKSRPFTAMVGARAMRAKGGTEVSAIAAMMFVDRGAEHGDDDQPEDQRREGEQHVHHLHGDGVEASAAPAGEHADQGAGQPWR